MSQIHAALSHYWHLRDQGLHPYTAQSHVLQRFGIAVDTEQPMASTAEVVREELDPNLAAGFGEDFCKTVWSSASSPHGLFGTAILPIGTQVRVLPGCSVAYSKMIGTVNNYSKRIGTVNNFRPDESALNIGVRFPNQPDTAFFGAHELEVVR